MGNHWPTAKEIAYTLGKASTDPTTGGAVLRYRDGQMLRSGGEAHTMYLGTSGSGKTTRGTIPSVLSILDAGEPVIVADSKGEIYRATASRATARGYTVLVYNFRNPKGSDHYDPLAAPYEKYSAGDRQSAAEMIETPSYGYFKNEDTSEAFWSNSARSLYNGAVRALFEHASAEQINMASVCNLVTSGNERVSGIPCLRSLVKDMPANSVASQQLQSYVTTANDTQAGIRSVFLEGLAPFTRNEGILEMLSSDDLHLNQLTGDQKLAIYVIVPEETPIYNTVAGTLISQLMFHFIHLAEQKHHGRLPLRHNFIIEELGNIAHAIPNLSHILSAGRSRNVRVQYVLQNLGQLEHAYGKADAETIISNTDVTIAFRTNNWGTLNELSRKCGEREIMRNGHRYTVPLVTPTQLSGMKVGQALVLVAGALHFITWLPHYTQMFDCSDWQEPVRQVHSSTSCGEVFDIVKYVKEKHEKPHAKDEIRFLENPPFYRPRPSSLPSFEDFIARMDRRLEEEEEIIIKPEPEQMPTDGYAVKVISSRRNRLDIAKAISKVCGIRIAEVMEKLSTLPASFHCDTKKDAEALEAAISAAYGIAIIQEEI